MDWIGLLKLILPILEKILGAVKATPPASPKGALSFASSFSAPEAGKLDVKTAERAKLVLRDLHDALDV